MTEIFRGGTTNDYALEFAERKKYISFLRSIDQPLLDTLYEKPLYGFLDRNYNVIAPSISADTTYLGESFGNYAPGIFGTSLIVNQFNKFRNHYIEKSQNGTLKFPDLVSKLTPVASYENFETGYERFTNFISDIIVSKALDSIFSTAGSRVLPYESFIKFVNDIIFDPDLISEPLTKTGFLLSQSSTVYNTGLYISLSDISEWRLEQTKVDFIKDDSFFCFVEIAAKFGFYVDAHYPWRIALNLSSEYTQKEILNGRPRDSFFNFYSDVWTMKVGLDDFQAIKKLYQRAYLEYLTQAGATVTDETPPLTTEVETKILLESLLTCKFKELMLMRHPAPGTLFKETLQNTLDIYDRFGLSSISAAVGYINDFSSKKLKDIILNAYAQGTQ